MSTLSRCLYLKVVCSGIHMALYIPTTNRVLGTCGILISFTTGEYFHIVPVWDWTTWLALINEMLLYRYDARGGLSKDLGVSPSLFIILHYLQENVTILACWRMRDMASELCHGILHMKISKVDRQLPDTQTWVIWVAADNSSCQTYEQIQPK